MTMDIYTLAATRPRVRQAFVAAEIAAIIGMAWLIGFWGIPLALLFIWAIVPSAISSGTDTGHRLATIWRNRIRDWGLWRKPARADWYWAGAGVVAVLLISGLFASLAGDAGFSAADSNTTTHRERAVGGQYGRDLQISFLLLSVVIGPLLEELAWRGYLIGGTRSLLTGNRLPRFVGCAMPLLVSATLFGLWHTQYNHYGHALAAVTGLIYGLVFIKTRNVLVSAAVHGANNALWALPILLT